MTDVVGPNGEIREDASGDDLSCIEAVRYKRSDTDTGSSVEREVKLSSKLKALELLGKHLGMWSDKLDVDMNIPVIISGEEQLEDQ